GGVRDGPVGGDRRRAGVWAADTGYVRQLGYLAQHRGDPLLCFWCADPARVGHYDLHCGTGLARDVLFQRVEHLLRLSPGQRVVVVVVASCCPGGGGDGGQRDHPRGHRLPAAVLRPRREPLEPTSARAGEGTSRCGHRCATSSMAWVALGSRRYEPGPLARNAPAEDLGLPPR